MLNAEQELLNSQVALVTARRDAYVAGFQLLNVMGAAEAEDLNLDGGPLYDPVVYYERYSGSWSDWDDGPRVRRGLDPHRRSQLDQPGDPAARRRPAGGGAAAARRRHQADNAVGQPAQTGVTEPR